MVYISYDQSHILPIAKETLKIMEHKTWSWRKKSFEKTIVLSKKSDISSNMIEDETLLGEEKAGSKSERLTTNSNEKLASNQCDCNAKDDLMIIHSKMTEEAIAGREKAEAEVVSLKQELDEAFQLGEAANERLTELEVALKECMQKLASFRHGEEQRVQDAVTKTSRDFEKVQKILEEKLRITNEKLGILATENSRLSKCKSQSEAEFNALMARLDSTEKENTFLKYEFRMLEKELEFRDEERELSRRSADGLQKEQVESVKKIAKLEVECQRLRKRLQSPTSLGKMKGEVEMLGMDQIEMRRRRKLNFNTATSGFSGRRSISILDSSPETPSKNISVLMERLCGVEEENKILKEIITEKSNELHGLGVVYAQTSSKLARVEAQLWELSGGQKPNELSLMSGFEVGNDDGISNSGSWTKDLQEHKMLGVSEMSLMDDFVEMEKLAIVSVDMPLGCSHVSSYASNGISTNLEKKMGSVHSNLTGKELVPVAHGETQTVDGSSKRSCDWLQDVLKAMLEEKRVSGRSLDELLEDIRLSLPYLNHQKSDEADAKISGYITWKSPPASPTMHSLNEVSRINNSMEERQNSQNVAIQMQKIQPDLKEENRRLKNELNNMEYANKDLELKLQSAANEIEALMKEVQESKQSIGRLKTEMETLKTSNGRIEDQIENQNLINEDLDTKLTITKGKLNAVVQKFSSLEVELEDKCNCCEELEATCLELQLQLESAAKKDNPKYNTDQEEKQTQTGWEITKASVKLAECQETIVNLGKQLKALASPREAALFDKVFSSTGSNNKNLRKPSTLRHQMLTEDDGNVEVQKSPKTKELANNADKKNPFVLLESSQAYLGSKQKSSNGGGVGALAIVPCKKNKGAGGFLRKLLLRRKKVSGKNTSLTFGIV